MTVCLVVSLPKIPYAHRIFKVLAKPTNHSSSTHWVYICASSSERVCACLYALGLHLCFQLRKSLCIPLCIGSASVLPAQKEFVPHIVHSSTHRIALLPQRGGASLFLRVLTSPTQFTPGPWPSHCALLYASDCIAAAARRGFLVSAHPHISHTNYAGALAIALCIALRIGLHCCRSEAGLPRFCASSHLSHKLRWPSHCAFLYASDCFAAAARQCFLVFERPHCITAAVMRGFLVSARPHISHTNYAGALNVAQNMFSAQTSCEKRARIISRVINWFMCCAVL